MRVVRTLFTGTLIAAVIAGLASIGRWIYIHRDQLRAGVNQLKPAQIP